MKKKVLVLSSLVIFSLIIGIVTLFYSDNDKIVLESGKSNRVASSNFLTMMFETASGSGEYQVASDNEWPIEGYTFNETLSSCENGSIITWDEENKKVLMQANTSDKCYVYFDYGVPCTNYMEVGDTITTKEENCGPFASGCSPTYHTENFVYASYVLRHETSELYENFPYVLESYYTVLLNPIGGNYENYTMGQEYGLYNDDYVIQTEPNQGFYAYSYKLASDQNYCDICINGYTGTVVDCNSENWWVNNGE